MIPRTPGFPKTTSLEMAPIVEQWTEHKFQGQARDEEPTIAWRPAPGSTSGHIFSMTSSDIIGGKVMEVAPDGQYSLTIHQSTKAPVITPGLWGAEDTSCYRSATHFYSHGTFGSIVFSTMSFHLRYKATILLL